MKAIKIGRGERRVVFENKSDNWDWLEKHSTESIDKPDWTATKNDLSHQEKINEDDAFLFLRQYYKNVCGYTEDRATLKATMQLWNHFADRKFEQHLLRNELISKDALVPIDGDLICEYIYTDWYKEYPTCVVRSYFRKCNVYYCKTIEWASIFGMVVDFYLIFYTHIGMPCEDSKRVRIVEPNEMLEALKCKRKLVWFLNDTRTIQLECLNSK